MAAVVRMIDRYRNAHIFRKVSILKTGRNSPWSWVVVGPRIPWLGKGFYTWQEAMDYANDFIRYNQ